MTYITAYLFRLFLFYMMSEWVLRAPGLSFYFFSSLFIFPDFRQFNVYIYTSVSHMHREFLNILFMPTHLGLCLCSRLSYRSSDFIIGTLLKKKPTSRLHRHIRFMVLPSLFFPKILVSVPQTF